MGTTLQKLIHEMQHALRGMFVSMQPSARSVQANKVVFTAHYGHGYGCNPKYIAEALIADAARAGVELDLVWLTAQNDASIPPAIRQVRYGTLAALRELATAKVWVDNMRTRRYLVKKPEQFYIQTWHGCLSPKRLEADIQDQLSRAYIEGAKSDSAQANLFLCNNDFFESILRKSFWYSGPILRCGLPRNAPLVSPSEEATRNMQAKVKRALQIPQHQQICLYAPTFRDDGSTQAYQFDYARCCEELANRFGGEFVFVLRLHPNVAQQSASLVRPGVVDATSYPDVQELLAAASVVISDYSTTIEDFALFGGPGYQYVPDAHKFASERGLYYPLEDRPYPLAYTEEELFEAIRTTTNETFQAKRDAFFNKVGMRDDGKGAHVVARVILDVVAGMPFDVLNYGEETR